MSIKYINNLTIKITIINGITNIILKLHLTINFMNVQKITEFSLKIEYFL